MDGVVLPTGHETEEDSVCASAISVLSSPNTEKTYNNCNALLVEAI